MLRVPQRRARRLYVYACIAGATVVVSLSRAAAFFCRTIVAANSLHAGAVGALTELETHKLVLDVFVKGTINIFQYPAQRHALVVVLDADAEQCREHGHTRAQHLVH